jgi:hypothetical protein
MSKHTNFFSVVAANNYDLGRQLGQLFAAQAHHRQTEYDAEVWHLRRQRAMSLLSISEQYFPQYIEELHGYADGAQMEFTDLWTLSVEADADPDHKDVAHCTNIATNQGMLIGHNEDAETTHEAESIGILEKTIGDLTTLEVFYFNTLGGNSTGINSHGYIQTVNTLFYTDRGFGIPRNVQARFLADTSDPQQDLPRLAALPRSTGYNHNLISPSGEMWNAEFTNDTAQISQPTLPFVHSNHCLQTSSPVRTDDYGTLSRLKFAQAQSRPDMSEDEMKNILSDTSLGTNCSIHNERTIAQVVFNQIEKKVSIWLKREAHLGWVSYDFPQSI